MVWKKKTENEPKTLPEVKHLTGSTLYEKHSSRKSIITHLLIGVLLTHHDCYPQCVLWTFFVRLVITGLSEGKLVDCRLRKQIPPTPPPKKQQPTTKNKQANKKTKKKPKQKNPHKTTTTTTHKQTNKQTNKQTKNKTNFRSHQRVSQRPHNTLPPVANTMPSIATF